MNKTESLQSRQAIEAYHVLNKAHREIRQLQQSLEVARALILDASIRESAHRRVKRFSNREKSEK